MNKNDNVNAYIDLLGKTVRDRVTGFAGIASTVGFDLYGCIQVAITPPVDKDGKIPDGRWFDVNRLEVTKSTRAMPLPSWPAKAVDTSGPAEKPVPR